MRNCVRFGMAAAIFSSLYVANHGSGEHDPSAKKSTILSLTVVGDREATILSSPNNSASQVGALKSGATIVATCLAEAADPQSSSVRIQNHPNAHTPEIGYIALYSITTEPPKPVFNASIAQIKATLPACR